MEFLRALISDYWDEALPLVQLHFEETGTMGAEDFSPAKEKYFEMERLGFSRLFIAKAHDHLIGYCILFVLNHHHYQNKKWAMQDVLFIHREYRGGSGTRFIDFIDDELRNEDVCVVCRPISPACDYSRALIRSGYEHLETSYIRRF